MNMQLIREITERDLNLANQAASKNRNGSRYWFRRAARAVVLNENNEMALLHVAKHNYYKLPGGGIEAQEQMLDALKREVLEEVGMDIVISDEIGLVIEYRDMHELIQFSYSFLAHTIGGNKGLSLTAEEAEQGLTIHWVTLENAISKLEQNKTDDYVSQFIRERDHSILIKLRDSQTL